MIQEAKAARLLADLAMAIGCTRREWVVHMVRDVRSMLHFLEHLCRQCRRGGRTKPDMSGILCGITRIGWPTAILGITDG